MKQKYLAAIDALERVRKGSPCIRFRLTWDRKLGMFTIIRDSEFKQEILPGFSSCDRNPRKLRFRIGEKVFHHLNQRYGQKQAA